MTIIEFYGKASIENIAGALLCGPERVIFIGDNRKQMEKSIAIYQKVLADRELHTEFFYKSVNKRNLPCIVDTLTQIVETYPDCVFDLTGGEELYLVAVGMVMNQYGGRLQCHSFNFQNGTIHDCDADGVVCQAESFDISVEENIRIYGGEIVRDSHSGLCTYDWSFDEEFVCDIEAMWAICRQTPRLWNAQITTFYVLNDALDWQDSLSVSFEKSSAAALLEQRGQKLCVVDWMLEKLQQNGLIRALTIGENTVSFSFKNRQVKRCLTVSGLILELMIANRLRSLRDSDGRRIYHDVKVGVILNWNPIDGSDAVQIVNEIDVIAMKGAIPIFISCKNGNFSTNELYKLNTVAERFGGRYAKKALVSTVLDVLGERADYLRTRMEDMKIRSVENVDELPDSELEKMLGSLWNYS